MKRTKPLSSDHLTRSALTRRGFTSMTISTLMHARRTFMLAVASAVIRLCETPGALKQLLARITQLETENVQLRAQLNMVQKRMSRIDAKHRSHYTAEERFNILVHKETYSLSLEHTASLFLVSMQTIKRWYDEALREPTKKTIGSLLKAVPPLMRYSDVTRNLVYLMDQMGFGGCKRVAQSLTRVVKTGRLKEGIEPGELPITPEPTRVGVAAPEEIATADITAGEASFAQRRAMDVAI